MDLEEERGTETSAGGPTGVLPERAASGTAGVQDPDALFMSARAYADTCQRKAPPEKKRQHGKKGLAQVRKERRALKKAGLKNGGNRHETHRIPEHLYVGPYTEADQLHALAHTGDLLEAFRMARTMGFEYPKQYARHPHVILVPRSQREKTKKILGLDDLDEVPSVIEFIPLRACASARCTRKEVPGGKYLLEDSETGAVFCSPECRMHAFRKEGYDTYVEEFRKARADRDRTATGMHDDREDTKNTLMDKKALLEEKVAMWQWAVRSVSQGRSIRIRDYEGVFRERESMPDDIDLDTLHQKLFGIPRSKVNVMLGKEERRDTRVPGDVTISGIASLASAVFSQAVANGTEMHVPFVSLDAEPSPEMRDLILGVYGVNPEDSSCHVSMDESLREKGNFAVQLSARSRLEAGSMNSMFSYKGDETDRYSRLTGILGMCGSEPEVYELLVMDMLRRSHVKDKNATYDILVEPFFPEGSDPKSMSLIVLLGGGSAAGKAKTTQRKSDEDAVQELVQAFKDFDM